MELTENNFPDPPSLLCPHCNGVIETSDSFCGHCGKEITLSEVITVENNNADVFQLLTPTLLFYFSSVLLLALYKLTSLFPEGFEGMVWVDTFDILIITCFWIYSIKDLKPLFDLKKVEFKIMALTIVGAVVGSIVVSILAGIINIAISEDEFYNTYIFQDTSYPVLFSILFIAVQPAIFEEVSFRGFMFSNLKQITTGNSAVYITGVLFGIMHFQIISLLWLIPIGLVFGYLRNRYDTLWYGIVGHFVYNSCIICYEFLHWF